MYQAYTAVSVWMWLSQCKQNWFTAESRTMEDNFSHSVFDNC